MDTFPPLLRHLLLILGAALLTWVGSDIVPWLRDQGGAVPALLAALVTTAVAILSPLIRDYGVGARPPAGGAVDEKFRR